MRHGLKRAGLLSLAIAMATGACGRPPDNNGGGTITTGSNTTKASGTVPRPRVGMVTTVHDQRVTIGGVVAGSMTDVAAGDTVASDANGSFDLTVGTSVHRCLTDHDSVLQVRPNATTLIAWAQGSSWCEKSGGADAQFGIGPGLMAVLKDPVFRVKVDSSATVLKVDKGFVQLRSAGGSIVVGPGQQVGVARGGMPGPVQPIVKDRQDTANFGALEKLAPPPTLGRPDPGGSTALARIFASHALPVRLTPPAGGSDQRSVNFARAFFDDLARHWDLKSSFSVQTAGAAAATTPSSTGVDVAPQLPNGLPLFSDGQVDWQLAGSDSGLQAALQDFLVSYLNSGDYANLYARHFQAPPPYEALASLVVPG